MTATSSLVYDPGLFPVPARIALVRGTGIPDCRNTVSMPGYLAGILDGVRAAGESYLPAARKKAVRDMLRFGKFAPSGRSRPSSEYLLASALRGGFPLVNPAVDVNNAVSLASGYPASIFDQQLCGSALLVRRGVSGESYVFNPSGQRIDLEDLLCVCRRDAAGWTPCGNPVKDSLATRTSDTTKNIVAIIYAPIADPLADLEQAGELFSSLLLSECGVLESGWFLP
jgi:DNA/RNA-binding domain of Phe-tRNA-synthetase-like protein